MYYTLPLRADDSPDSKDSEAIKRRKQASHWDFDIFILEHLSEAFDEGIMDTVYVAF